jgi:phage tail-like protein
MKQKAIEFLLPEVFRRTVRPGEPLDGILRTMEDLHAPSIEILGRFDAYLDPYRTSDGFVPYLARWLDLERLFDDPNEDYTVPDEAHPPISSGLGRLRELIAWAAKLSQRRGTRQGLLKFLEVATGIPGFSIDEDVMGPDGRALPFHIRVRSPQAARIHRSLIERIISLEKPAYVTYELDFGS